MPHQGESPSIRYIYLAFDDDCHRAFRRALARSRGGVVRVDDLLAALAETLPALTASVLGASLGAVARLTRRPAVSADLRHKLLNGLPVTAEEDIALRGAVYDAIMLLSELTGLRNPSQLHYLFWNVFRTHCLRESPLCFQPAPALPERYRHLATHGGGRHCPFAEVCKSASSTQRYYEHVFETDYY